MHLVVNTSSQQLDIIENDQIIQTYPVSTGKNGLGEEFGSEKTPRGWHIIRAKIGENCPENTVFRGRRPTGELCTRALYDEEPGRDWILTRIMWLSGCEIGKNRLGNVDTMRRYIYIHGTPDWVKLGIPGSRGCIRMYNRDIITLFDTILVGTKLLIC